MICEKLVKCKNLTEDHLQAMEEELMKHQMKSNAIEISLQAILDKLNILPRNEDVMQSELDFRNLESEDELRDSQRKADEGTASTPVKVKPRQQTLMVTKRKDAHSSIHVASTSWLLETSFQMTCLRSTGYSPSSNQTE